jgi:hypothetical protein
MWCRDMLEMVKEEEMKKFKGQLAETAEKKAAVSIIFDYTNSVSNYNDKR